MKDYAVAHQPPPLSRRRFLRTAGAAWASVHFIPVRAFGANSRLNLAGVGIGGVGFPQLRDCEKAGFNIAALCDVDDVYAKKAFDKWPQARRYRDFREMLRAEDDKVDAVYCGTPDHTHAIITLAALRRKKHVCCVKPLTRTIHESRVVVEAARKAGVATQVTAQANTSDTACRTCELIAGGAIGAVREVHVWSNRPLWPQGMQRPPGEDAVPASFDWKLWLGPAPLRPFKQGVYHPGSLKYLNWFDLSNGMLAGMGSHTFSLPVRALKLGEPVRVEADITEPIKETYVSAGRFRYEFAARGNLAPVTLWWTDGNKYPPGHVTENLRAMSGEVPKHGCLFLGDKGELYADGWGTHCVMKLKGDKHWRGVLDHEAAKPVPVTLPRVEADNHMIEWLQACAGGPATFTNLEVGAHCCQVFLPGIISLRLGRPIEWDAANLKVPGAPEADALIQKNYRMKWMMA